jgi:hypothetical protein
MAELGTTRSGLAASMQEMDEIAVLIHETDRNGRFDAREVTLSHHMTGSLVLPWPGGG